MRIEFSGLQARHPAAPPDTSALRGIELRIEAGEQVAVIGPSGAGKTTLLQVAAAALKPSAGSMSIDGQAPWSLGTRDLQRLRGRLFLAPQVAPLPPRQRVVTAVLAGRLPAWSLWRSLRSLVHPTDIEAAQAALDRFDLGGKTFERVDRLSGGERQRVGLARALLSPASLWLIDEPLSALDPSRAAQALSALTQEARDRGVTLLATMHQVDMALAHFPRVLGLRDGALLFDLPASEVGSEVLAALYAQHEDELRGEAGPPRAEAPPAAAMPAFVQCR